MRGKTVVIAADLELVQSAAIETGAALVVAIVLALVAAWFCARWLAAQALAPIIAVTEHEAIGKLIDDAVKYGACTSEAIVRVRSGIPEADRERIFERFFRGAEHREIAGFGLGLAIGERAAARFGGTIVLEDGSPGATTFRLTLPSAAAARADRTTLRL